MEEQTIESLLYGGFRGSDVSPFICARTRAYGSINGGKGEETGVAQLYVCFAPRGKRGA